MQDFDKYIICNTENCRLEYGIVFGSNNKKLLFIKAGQDGSARGYRNKYLKLAHEIREEYGMSVVCSSNPDTEINQMDHAMQILSKEGLLAADTQVYFAGFSKGASIGCLQGANYPQITRSISQFADNYQHPENLPRRQKLYWRKDEFRFRER